MLGVGYGAERDPNAECSHLGMGKQRHVFSAEAREAFNRFDRTPLVDRIVSFVDGPVDHWGNVPPAEGEEATETSGLESWQKGMETEVKTGRFDYWLPREGGLSEYGVEAGDEMLREMGWLHSMLAGRASGPRQ